MIKVLLADDHPVVRSGLRAVLTLDPDLDIIADVATPTEAVKLAPQAEVVLLDLQFGHDEAGGLNALRTIAQQPDAPAVVMLTTFDAEADVMTALELGAAGYLLKDADPGALQSAVHRAANGETVFAPEVATRLAERVRRPATALSSRELEVLAEVARGRSNDEIGKALFVSRATVKTHLAHIFDKLGVGSRSEAVARAVDLGLLRR